MDDLRVSHLIYDAFAGGVLRRLSHSLQRMSPLRKAAHPIHCLRRCAGTVIQIHRLLKATVHRIFYNSVVMALIGKECNTASHKTDLIKILFRVGLRRAKVYIGLRPGKDRPAF